jgi:hypothetical protein
MPAIRAAVQAGSNYGQPRVASHERRQGAHKPAQALPLGQLAKKLRHAGTAERLSGAGHLDSKGAAAWILG